MTLAVAGFWSAVILAFVALRRPWQRLQRSLGRALGRWRVRRARRPAVTPAWIRQPVRWSITTAFVIGSAWLALYLWTHSGTPGNGFNDLIGGG